MTKLKKLLIAIAASLTAFLIIPTDCPAVKTGYSHIKRFKVTAYCPCQICCGSKANGITASGHVIKAGQRFVAAGTAYPFGIRMNIPFYGLVKVKDRGSAIRNDCIDVFFPTHQQAIDWGIKFLDVEIYE